MAARLFSDARQSHDCQPGLRRGERAGCLFDHHIGKLRLEPPRAPFPCSASPADVSSRSPAVRNERPPEDCTGQGARTQVGAAGQWSCPFYSSSAAGQHHIQGCRHDGQEGA
ncbi:uncharacterized protein LOC117724373 isoform X1 [Arvicanthis niloticus]|uniref:uncharacterized protein LOC117724373 isoform X1 n=1 Tax=Arvicanthis niloticus TaxID=61156 RepID=UPI00402B8F91